MFTNRVLNANPVTLENLRNMAGDISRAAAGILPDIKLDAMIYGCTSGTVANGVEKIEQLIHQSCPGVPVTNPASAALAAFAHFGAQRISILTPYTEAVNLEMANFFELQGIEVINIVGLGYDSDMDMAGIPPNSIAEVAEKVCDKNADLLFVSCTAIRAAAVIEEIEKAINKPVVTSNQANTATDNTELKPGMVMTLEPGMSYDGGKQMVHEENILITDSGAIMLSKRAAVELPIIQ